MTRFARPAGSPLTAFTVCPTGCRQFVEPRSGLLIPPVCAIYEKKKPVLSYELFFKYGGEGGIDSLRSPAGSPLTAFTVCPTGCRQLSNPGRGFSSPRCVQYTKKKPVLSYELFFKYAVRGGLTRFARPAGRPAHCVHGLSNWLSPVVEPRSGLSHPPGVCNIRKKSPYFRTSSSLNMAVRGGIDSLRSPAGSPLTAFTVCPTGCRQLSNPGRGFSSPRCGAIYEKKARTFVRALL